MTAKLRCQPGDLALVLRGLYTGSVVTVIELADEELLDEMGVADNSRPCWGLSELVAVSKWQNAK